MAKKQDTSTPEADAGKSAVTRAYEHLRHMVMTYQFLPGEKLNERALAMQLNASRTPLREALNRLVSEGLVTSTAREGFACRPLDPKEIFDLYELRAIMESHGARLATERASDADIAALEPLLEAAAEDSDQDAEMVDRDIRFHEAIARLSGNGELYRQLQTINTRVYFIRWIDRSTGRPRPIRRIRTSMTPCRPDGAKASQYMYDHIHRRMEHIIDVVRAGFAHLYTEKSIAALGSDYQS